jgi:hypothetical protein
MITYGRRRQHRQHRTDVTQASLLMNAGLHFNITEGPPLSEPHEIISIITRESVFLGKMGLRERVTCVFLGRCCWMRLIPLLCCSELVEQRNLDFVWDAMRELAAQVWEWN